MRYFLGGFAVVFLMVTLPPMVRSGLQGQGLLQMLATRTPTLTPTVTPTSTATMRPSATPWIKYTSTPTGSQKRTPTSTLTRVPTHPPTKTPIQADTYVRVNGVRYPAWYYCTNANPSIIMFDDDAYVNPNPPTPNNLRDQPRLSAKKIGEIPVGIITDTTVLNAIVIMDGPKCVNNYVWWYVKYKNLYGWTSEGDSYWLLPILEER